MVMPRGRVCACVCALSLAACGGQGRWKAGAEGQACFPDDTCDEGLSCRSNRCVDLGDGGGGDGPDAGGSTFGRGSGGAPAAGGAPAGGGPPGDGGRPSAGGADAGGRGGVGAGGEPSKGSCEGACCPTSSSCYPDRDPSRSGAECLGTIENAPGGGRVQLRQTWLRHTAPTGFTIPIVYQVMNTYTQLPWPECNTPNGASGHIQLIDLDLSDPDPSKHTQRMGFAKFTTAAEMAGALADGLCMTSNAGWSSVVQGTSYAIAAADMQPRPPGWPRGLVDPMPQPWAVRPTRAVRVPSDFDVRDPAQRAAILATLAPDGANGQRGYGGIFHYDAEAGVVHGYANLLFAVVYEGGPSGLLVIPIREPETRIVFNDPAHPNCAGVYRGDLLEAPECQPASDPSAPDHYAWSGEDGRLGEGPARIDGYALLSELEQIYSPLLAQTLCVGFPTFDASKSSGWATDADKRCRSNPAFDAKDRVGGLPLGDWCSDTNAPATADCHDAFKITAFQTFQSFKIASAECSSL